MSLDEVFEYEPMISKAEAMREIVKQHGCDWSEFVADYGDHAEYNGADVLIWLGY